MTGLSLSFAFSHPHQIFQECWKMSKGEQKSLSLFVLFCFCFLGSWQRWFNGKVAVYFGFATVKYWKGLLLRKVRCLETVLSFLLNHHSDFIGSFSTFLKLLLNFLFHWSYGTERVDASQCWLERDKQTDRDRDREIWSAEERLGGVVVQCVMSCSCVIIVMISRTATISGPWKKKCLQ